jgi:hypothetical protein
MTKKIQKKDLNLQSIKAENYLHVQDRNMDYIKILADKYENLSRLYTLSKDNFNKVIFKDEELNEEYDLNYLFNKDGLGMFQFMLSRQMNSYYDEIKQWIENDKPDFFPK